MLLRLLLQLIQELAQELAAVHTVSLLRVEDLEVVTVANGSASKHALNVPITTVGVGDNGH